MCLYQRVVLIKKTHSCPSSYIVIPLQISICRNFLAISLDMAVNSCQTAKVTGPSSTEFACAYIRSIPEQEEWKQAAVHL